jgi:hypothetical protein
MARQVAAAMVADTLDVTIFAQRRFQPGAAKLSGSGIYGVTLCLAAVH